ncbi:MAG TPA: hypothetical protein PLE30_03430 [Candidatus Kapabacteria bacterium]|nr:hypothetical protein [Candidatus Kapabacteria bacterium]
MKKNKEEGKNNKLASVDGGNEALMRDMIKKEMLQRIEKRIDDNDTVFIKNIKNMLLDKDDEHM